MSCEKDLMRIDHHHEEINVDRLIELLKKQFVSSASSVVTRRKLKNHHDDHRMDFLLIGSRALRYYYSEQGSDLNDLDENLYRNHFVMKQIRKRFVHHDESDWDFICFDMDSVVDLLEMKRNQIMNVRINYLVRVDNFTHENLSNTTQGNEMFVERINEIMPSQWTEISFCLRLTDGSIIEMEYSDDNYTMMTRYLGTTVQKLGQVPLLTKCHIAPLELLEVLKRSHLCQNIELEKWKTHLIDLSFIRLVRHYENLFHNSSFENAMDNQSSLDMIYYDRLIKLLVLQILFKSQDEITEDIYEEISKSLASYVATKSYPFNNTKDKLCNEISPSSVKILKEVFKVKPINRRIMHGTDDIDFYPESLDYVAQQLCALILPRFNTWREVDLLDEHLLVAFQKVCLAHHDNKILEFVVNGNIELAERVNSILNQPIILKKFFKEQEIDFKLSHNENNITDIDITSLEGANMCGIYIPYDIISKFMCYTSGKEMCYMSMLNKEWHCLFSNGNIWKHMCSLKGYLSRDLVSRILDWKVFSIIGYDKELLSLPSNENLSIIVSVFKPHFLNNPSESNRFITHVFPTHS